MDTSTATIKPHIPHKDKTRTVSYRLPEKIVQEMETEAMQRGISQNVLIRQILEKFVQWDRFGDKIGMIPVPKGILQSPGGHIWTYSPSKPVIALNENFFVYGNVSSILLIYLVLYYIFIQNLSNSQN